MGEAAGRVSYEGRAQNPDIPWTQITALRNRLVHAYDSVDLSVLWSILTDDLPPLIANLERAMRPER